jgi:hypothetical protein
LAEGDSFHQTREHANELGLRGLQFRAFQLLEHSGGMVHNKKDVGWGHYPAAARWMSQGME